MIRQNVPVSKECKFNPRSILSFLSINLYKKFLSPSIFFGSKFNIGMNVFEKNWDLLIVLDTCRPDALEELSDEYSFINDFSEYWSVGGDSWEWIANTFDCRFLNIIQNTAYITSNPNSKTVLENQFENNHNDEAIERKKVNRLMKYGDFNLITTDQLGKYRSLYKQGIDQNHGMYPSPRTVTDHGIATDRNNDFNRIILHYMPPHWPYLAFRQEDTDTGEGSKEINIKIKGKSRGFSWEAYLDNLRWGLDEVKIVLQNMDRENVIITADHGESFSEYFPRHLSGSINPKVRKVPWLVTTANDSRSYEPDVKINESQYSADEIMDALGYKT